MKDSSSLRPVRVGGRDNQADVDEYYRDFKEVLEEDKANGLTPERMAAKHTTTVAEINKVLQWKRPGHYTQDSALSPVRVGGRDGVTGARWVAAGAPGREDYRIGNKYLGSVYLYKGWVGETLLDDKQFGYGQRLEAKRWVEVNATNAGPKYAAKDALRPVRVGGRDDLMSQREEENLRKALRKNKGGIEAYGVKGFKNTSWRKVFKSREALEKWCEENDAEVQGTRDVE
jgi:hypothetical protein